MSSFCRRWLVSFSLAICFAGALGILSAASGEDLRETTSLKFAPASVSFYATMLRNREQFENFLGSNTYNKIRNLPLVNFGLSALQGQWDNPTNDELRMFKEQWEKEENQQLTQLLLDAVSQEIFVYGDERFTDALKLGQEVQRMVRAMQVRAAQDPTSNPEIQQKLIDEGIVLLNQFKMPSVMIGFRLTNTKTAEAQLDRLEKLLGEVLSQQPELQPIKDRLKRESIDGSSFLVLPLDASLIPWDQIPEQSREELGDDTMAKIKLAVAKIKLTISLGVKNDCLLLTIGESTDPVKQLGTGKLLVDKPELAPLRKHADKRIVSVGYTSSQFLEQANSASGQIDDMVAYAEMFLPMAELDEKTTADMLADVKSLASELKSFLPKPGAMSGFSFLTDRGFEAFQYKWGEDKVLDGTRKLSILDHIGGEPVAFAAGRSKYSPESYDWVAKWAGKIWQHAQTVASAKLEGEEKQHFEQVREKVLPLIERFDKVTREQLLPSLKDGQAAIVLDTKARSKQWQKELPSTRVALPMFELAIVCGVSDSAALKRAGAEYFSIAQAAADIAHELHENEVPKITLPQPNLESTSDGEIYSYAIPEQAGLDAQVAPNIGLSQDTLTFSAFPDQTKRLLKGSAAKRLGPLAKADQPLAGASYCNVGGVIDAISPWVNYAVRIAGQVEGEDNPQTKMAAQMVAGNVTPILEVMKSLGEYASVTYIEGDAVVTHSATFLMD